MNVLKNVGLSLLFAVVSLSAIAGVYYVPLDFAGLLALVAIWMVVGIMVGERMPRGMSSSDYLKSKESFAPIVLAALMYVGLLIVYAIRETAKLEAGDGPQFVWKGSEIFGFLVVGIGGLTWGFLLGSLLRPSANDPQPKRRAMFYVNYDKFTVATATIHHQDCIYVQRAWEEKPEEMKRVSDGYWLKVRRMEDAVQVSLDLGATLHYGNCCWIGPSSET